MGPRLSRTSPYLDSLVEDYLDSCTERHWDLLFGGGIRPIRRSCRFLSGQRAATAGAAVVGCIEPVDERHTIELLECFLRPKRGQTRRCVTHWLWLLRQHDPRACVVET
jgi:hypothetical protein